MSQIKLLHSGGNGVIISAPDSNPASDRTLKLPSDVNSTIDTLNRAGNILQVVSVTKTDTFSTASTSQVDITGYSVDITPSSSSNKILISGTLMAGLSTTIAYGMRFYLMRDSTAICIGDTAGNRSRCTFGTQGVYNTDTTHPFSFEFLDSPSTTSTVTYKIQVQSESPMTIYINRSAGETDGDSAITPRFTSTISVKEVAA
tara:strand:+ start:13123 stop:13728 length:606 start_codon:yes stop_codon:yes gene_type:complete